MHFRAMGQIGAISLVLFLVAVSFISIVAIGQIHYGTSTTSTTKYPVGWIFYVVISYDHQWNVSYQGYNGPGQNDPTNRGNYSGSGSMTAAIGVNGTFSNGLTLCIDAQKKDSSNSTLVAYIYPDNPSFNGINYRGVTTKPYGTVSVCFQSAPY
jgi:hypothetical protein